MKKAWIALTLCLALVMACAPMAFAAGDDASGTIAYTAAGASLSGTGLELDEESGAVTITEGGTYIVTGKSDNARIVVKGDERVPVTLILAGAALANAEKEVIFFKRASACTLKLADGTENTLVCGAPTDAAEAEDETDDETDDDTPKGAVRAKVPLTIMGGGSLEIMSYVNHGLFAGDSLVIYSGALSVTAANDAIHGKTDITIHGGSFDLTAEHDGIQAGETLMIEDGSFSITTGVGAEAADMKTGDSIMMEMGGGGRPGGMQGFGSDEAEDTGSHKGLKADSRIEISGGTFDIDAEDDAVHCDGDIVISGGTLAILSGDDGVHGDDSLLITGGVIDVGLSFEGLEAPDILITDGWISVVAVDDGMNANGGGGMPFGGSGEASSTQNPVLRITGGTVYVDAGGDGLDSNGDLYIDGGEVYISGPSTNWDSPIDYGEGSSEFIITGGTVMAAGYSGMAESPDSTSDAQPSIFYVSEEYAPDGETVRLSDAAGNTLMEYAFAHSFNCVILSSPALTVGETYYLTIGGSTAEIVMTDTLYSNQQRGGFGGGMPGFGSRG